MAKNKTVGVPNRQLYSRVSFLYQAAAYLAAPQQQQQDQAGQGGQDTSPGRQPHLASKQDAGSLSQASDNGLLDGMACRLLTDLRSVSLKRQMRLNPNIKRAVCKYCDSLLIEGQSCSSTIENPSKGGKKPWADVLVVRCSTCRGERRYPVSACRQKRRTARAAEDKQPPEKAAPG